jgi:ribonucleoside-diphosphate reductase alpha chain/ribonucleoside-triphosphate reductase
MRMGIGITGYLQSSAEQKSWLSDLYEYLREYDVNYSKKIGVGTSVKLTTVKPSGTLSLLSGVCSGAHPGIYQYFIRRIRIGSSNTQLINLAKKNNFRIEYQLNFDGTEDKKTQIIEFPCRYPEGTVLAKDMSAIDQLNVIKDLQTNWSDNSVSVTIYYRLHELEEIKEWLIKNFRTNIKTCSFLLHNEHGFKQAPFEEISKETYEEMIKKVIPITSGNINSQSDNELTSDCAGGACPVR